MMCETGTGESKEGLRKIRLLDSDEEVLIDQQDRSVDSSAGHGDC